LALTRDVLEGLGLSDAEVRQSIDTFEAFDRRRLYEDYKHRSDPDKLRARAMKQAEELEQLFAQDERDEQEQVPQGR
jgi:hypothetical protein